MDRLDYGSNDDHDRYLRKNQALSRAYDIDRKDKLKGKISKGEIKPVMHKCHKCKQDRLCMPFTIFETGHFDGVTSVSKEMVQLCDECRPGKKKQNAEMSKKQIKALLRGAKKGRL